MVFKYFTKTYKRWTSSKEYEQYENGEYTGTFDKNGNKVYSERDYWNDFYESLKEQSRRRQESYNQFFQKYQTAKKVTLSDGEEDFINFINNKVARGSNMSKSELEDFATLTGFTYEQIANMDKGTYRQLCIKYHPDHNTTNPFAERIFGIIQNLYKHRKAA